MHPDRGLDHLDDAEVARALGGPVTAYDVSAIDPELRLHSVTGGVFRVRADDGRRAVLKVIRRGHDEDPAALWVSGAEPTHRNYWKREWLAFDSGLLATLPGRLRAPAALLTTEPAPDVAHVWMAEVDGVPGQHWALDDYDAAARDLGTTQGAFAAGAAALPDDEWLSRGWLRAWVAAAGVGLAAAADDRLWSLPALAPLRPLRERAAAVHAASDQLLAIVEEAPKTLVHLDFWPMNLLRDPDGNTVAVDWSQVGIGAIAQELDQLTLDPVWMQVLPGADLAALDRHVVPPYVEGLRAAGLDVDERTVRRWHDAAASAHYAPMLGMLVQLVHDAGRVAATERRWGRPIAAVVADRARVLERAVEQGERVLGG